MGCMLLLMADSRKAGMGRSIKVGSKWDSERLK